MLENKSNIRISSKITIDLVTKKKKNSCMMYRNIRQNLKLVEIVYFSFKMQKKFRFQMVPTNKCNN